MAPLWPSHVGVQELYTPNAKRAVQYYCLLVLEPFESVLMEYVIYGKVLLSHNCTVLLCCLMIVTVLHEIELVKTLVSFSMVLFVLAIFLRHICTCGLESSVLSLYRYIYKKQQSATPKSVNRSGASSFFVLCLEQRPDVCIMRTSERKC
jgi:hypothetical protein